MESKRVTLNQWQARYENYLRLTVSKHYLVKAAGALSKVFKRFPEKRYPEDFSRLDAEDYRIFREREVKATTVANELRCLRAFWNWLLENGGDQIPQYNPVSHVVRHKNLVEHRQPRYLSEAEQTALGFDLETTCLPAQVMLTTGRQASELPELTWREVESLVGPLGKALDEKVFPGRNAVSLRREIHIFLRKKGVERPPEALRWTWAVRALRGGASIEEVKERMGVRRLVL